MSKRREKGQDGRSDSRNSTVEIRASIRQAIEELAHNTTDSNALLQERRSGNDRRGWQAMPPAPFVDAEGTLVTHDRRKAADRRVNNIEVAWKGETDT